MERTLINENIVHLRDTDLQKIILREFKHSNGARRKCLGRSLNCSKQMLRDLEDAKKHVTSKRSQEIRSSLSINKFETAIKLFPDHVLHLSWRFNYAKYLNQYCDIVEQPSKLDNLDKSDEIKTITLKAVNLFWKIIKESTPVDMTLYVARSYTYIDPILARRLSMVKNDINIFSDSEIGDMLESPLAALEKAYELAPDDTTVLNRYGRSLWINSQNMDSNAKIQLLKKTEDILTKSVEKNSKRNWFAYATRQIIRRDMVNSLRVEDSSKEQYIKLAIPDGHQCFL